MADLIPAAQYLRMSTDYQQYSLENQASAIQKYVWERHSGTGLTYRIVGLGSGGYWGIVERQTGPRFDT